MGATIAAIGLVIGAASTAYSIYNQASMPGPPDLAHASREAANAAANALAPQRTLSAAAAQGTTVVRNGYTQETLSGKDRQALQGQVDKLQAQLERERQHPITTRIDRAGNIIDSSDRRIAGFENQIASLKSLADVPDGGVIYRNAKGKVVPASEALADFSGFGTADVQGKLAQQMADIQKELGAKYGVQFAEEARRELEQSDPEGFAARLKQDELIKKQLNQTPERPVAGLLERQVGEQLQAGNRLDPMERDILDQAVRDAQSARGQSGMGADEFAAPMESGFEGEARRQAGIRKALGWETSGATPEDVEYRRREQGLANEGSFINGQSPVTQFQNLSGAQQGPTPFVPGAAQPMMSNPNNAAAGGFALGNWETQMKQASNTANPWMAGLTALLKGANAMSTVQPGGTAG